MDLWWVVAPAVASWLALPVGDWRRWAGWTWWTVCLVMTALGFAGLVVVGWMFAGTAPLLGLSGDASFDWLAPWGVAAVALHAGSALGQRRRSRSDRRSATAPR